MSITVFLADDHKIVCDSLEVLLNSEVDIHVIGQAANGEDAVAQVDELHPNVVILDINMPKMNGLEAARQIIRSDPSIPVIILSMYDSNELIFRALQAGAKGYLLKDSAGVEVVEAVRAVHAGCRYLSQKIADEVINDYLQLRQEHPTEHPFSRLSPREYEVLQWMIAGKSRADIAESLCLSRKTVDTYRSRIMRKLEVKDLPSLVKLAIQHGLTPLN